MRILDCGGGGTSGSGTVGLGCAGTGGGGLRLLKASVVGDGGECFGGGVEVEEARVNKCGIGRSQRTTPALGGPGCRSVDEQLEEGELVVGGCRKGNRG